MKIDINVPDGISGDWKVESFKITEEESKFASLRALFHEGRGNIYPGMYKKLTRNGQIIMSNTLDEIKDFLYFVRIAKGNILINGLGSIYKEGQDEIPDSATLYSIIPPFNFFVTLFNRIFKKRNKNLYDDDFKLNLFTLLFILPKEDRKWMLNDKGLFGVKFKYVILLGFMFTITAITQILTLCLLIAKSMK